MKKLVVLLALTGSSILAYSTYLQNDNGLARVRKVSGKYAFVDSEPVNDYDVVFEFKATPITYAQVYPLSQLQNFVINAAARKSEGKEYDGVIIYSGRSHVAIKFKQ